eukprot:3774196-Ditylum_brightwellii.AAC.1
MEHHDKACVYLHWCIIPDEDQSIVPNWKQCKRVNHTVAANHPNLVLFEEQKKTSLFVDVTCPTDVNMVTAAAT